ncbi:hypothetical protein CL3_34710 [butyrate-producing bacterium SM4/1]|nr:hypothetical protein CLOM621_05550 [Clostridium sp. M62/1]CBL37102.1 hypothetical protein CL3_34710 [butyrate-producing bacterium SM4/1]
MRRNFGGLPETQVLDARQRNFRNRDLRRAWKRAALHKMADKK